MIGYLEAFCKTYTIPEETALHIKIFVLKQLQELNFSDFEKYQAYYRDLLEQNFALLISAHENEEALQSSGNERAQKTQKDF